MNREIKFRTWIALVPPLTPYMDYDRRLIEFLKSGEIATGTYPGSMTILSKKEHLMQYSGLKDKNGKEIYEGDILEWFRPKEMHNPKTADEIAWEELDTQLSKKQHFGELYIEIPWGCMLKEKTTPADGNDKNHSMFKQENIDEWKVSVIGNIYENPELLK